MGKTQSKEEVIIAQSGNSGGVTADGHNANGIAAMDILKLVSCTLLIVGLVWSCCRRSKKALELKIRREITRSQELI